MTIIGHLIMLISQAWLERISELLSVCNLHVIHWKSGYNFAAPQGAAWMCGTVILREWHRDKHIIHTRPISVQTPGGTLCFTVVEEGDLLIYRSAGIILKSAQTHDKI